MFTGIISAIGTIKSVEYVQSGREIVVGAPGFFTESQLGDSVANNGVCLTVTEFDQDQAKFFAQEETLSKTTVANWKVGEVVNLEHPLRLNDLLGGHLVQGHVDDVAQIESIETCDDASRVLAVEIPDKLRKYVAPRGSIAINGVSLTVAEKTATGCKIALIPATIENTTFSKTLTGDIVNIEVDCIARYVEQLLGASKG